MNFIRGACWMTRWRIGRVVSLEIYSRMIWNVLSSPNLSMAFQLLFYHCCLSERAEQDVGIMLERTQPWGTFWLYRHMWKEQSTLMSTLESWHFAFLHLEVRWFCLWSEEEVCLKYPLYWHQYQFETHHLWGLRCRRWNIRSWFCVLPHRDCVVCPHCVSQS